MSTLCVVAILRYKSGMDHAGGIPTPSPLPDLNKDDLGSMVGGSRADLIGEGIDLSTFSGEDVS